MENINIYKPHNFQIHRGENENKETFSEELA